MNTKPLVPPSAFSTFQAKSSPVTFLMTDYSQSLLAQSTVALAKHKLLSWNIFWCHPLTKITKHRTGGEKVMRFSQIEFKAWQALLHTCVLYQRYSFKKETTAAWTCLFNSSLLQVKMLMTFLVYQRGRSKWFWCCQK